MVIFHANRVKKINQHLAIAEVTVIKGELPLKSGFITKLKYNEDEVFDGRIYFLEINKTKNKYRLYIDTHSNTAFHSNEQLDRLAVEPFAGVALEHPAFYLRPNLQKVVIICDELAICESIAFSHLLSKQKIAIELYIFKTKELDSESKDYYRALFSHQVNFLTEMSSVYESLSYQLIGTKLFLAGNWKMVNEIRQLAKKIGFGEDEVHASRYGKDEERIFCVKCLSINKKEEAEYQVCSSCKTRLELTTRYSKRLQAYLGFVHGGNRRVE